VPKAQGEIMSYDWNWLDYQGDAEYNEGDDLDSLEGDAYEYDDQGEPKMLYDVITSDRS